MVSSVLAGVVSVGAGALQAQSNTQTPNPAPQSSTPPSSPATAGQDDNPFPGEPQKTTDQPKTGQDGKPSPSSGQKPAAQSGGDNPFPGETSDVPIIPVDPGPTGNAASSRDSANKGASRSGGGAPAAGDVEGDPVRSPDGPGNAADDGFSSSSSGLSGLPAGDDAESKPGKAGKPKTRAQVIKEDVDVGGFYLEKKNWKAAQDRFGAAFALDNENEEAVWGLAEAERHLQLYEKAQQHYELFLTYDPSGPHGRAARKALEQVEAARASSHTNAIPPK